eukprot:TRINITY_DN4974_c0_g1_i10.p1 TRINITY_DN4974_c0_g1~~TRINITY_DN4974_c0_g1_i10.p1  ORF type:complete len:324 (+),score=154.94 TRINITY_DN4974_c0_g1_i10:113-1084(+)
MGNATSCNCESVLNKDVAEITQNGMSEAESLFNAAGDAMAEATETGEKLIGDVKSGKAAEDIKEAVQAAVEKVEEKIEDAKSGKLTEDVKEAVQEAVQSVQVAVEGAAATVQEEVKEAVAAVEGTAEPAVAPSMTVTFELKGKTTEVKFERRPLGFAFGPQKKTGCCSGGGETGKFIVLKIESKDLKDVKAGMIIKKINNVEIPDKKEWVELQELMAVSAKALPQAEESTPKTPEAASTEVVAASAPEAKTDAAPEVAPEVKTDAAPEAAAPEAKADTTPEAAPAAAAEAPEAKAETAPEAAPAAAAEAKAETAPEAAPTTAA